MSETRAVMFRDGFYGVAKGEQVLHTNGPGARLPARYSTLDNAKRDSAKFNSYQSLSAYVWRRYPFNEVESV